MIRTEFRAKTRGEFVSQEHLDPAPGELPDLDGAECWKEMEATGSHDLAPVVMGLALRNWRGRNGSGGWAMLNGLPARPLLDAGKRDRGLHFVLQRAGQWTT